MARCRRRCRRYGKSALQIRPMPEDDDDETGEYEENDSLRLNGKENKGMGDLALHLKTLEIFFQSVSSRNQRL